MRCDLDPSLFLHAFKHIVDAVRYDATPANIAGVLHIINKEADIFEDDSFCEDYIRKGGY